MKLVVPSTGESLESQVDPRFGRAAFFCVVDTETGESEFLSNEQNVLAPQGAGVQAAQTVVDAGAEAVAATHLGPKAFSVLSAAGLEIHVGAEGTVQEACQAFKEGRLEKTKQANVEGHW